MYIVSSYWYGIGALLALCGFGVWYGIRTQKRQNLAKRVIKLGNMAGKTYHEIESALGAPADVNRFITTNTNEWVKNVAWRAGGYQIIIMFDKNDVCHLC